MLSFEAEKIDGLFSSAEQAKDGENVNSWGLWQVKGTSPVGEECDPVWVVSAPLSWQEAKLF